MTPTGYKKKFYVQFYRVLYNFIVVVVIIIIIITRYRLGHDLRHVRHGLRLVGWLIGRSVGRRRARARVPYTNKNGHDDERIYYTRHRARVERYLLTTFLRFCYFCVHAVRPRNVSNLIRLNRRAISPFNYP